MKVNNSETSGNLDAPEGSFDAIMQTLVCEVRFAIVQRLACVIIFVICKLKLAILNQYLSWLLDVLNFQIISVFVLIV